MVNLVFINADGSETTIQAKVGDSVMHSALAKGVSGITAECNGSAACATCHAYFEKRLSDVLPTMEEHEDDMLDFAACPREAGSRLSCQVTVTEEMDGARIRIPEMQ